MHPHTSSFSYRIAAAAARLGVLLTPWGLDDVLTASAVCFLALGFWLPIRHALIERHYFPSHPHFFHQRSCEQLQPYVAGSTPCRLALCSIPRASSRRTSLQLLVARATRSSFIWVKFMFLSITVSLIAPPVLCLMPYAY